MQPSPNEVTYLHCIVMNPVGWERLHDAHVAGKTTHRHTHNAHKGGYSVEPAPYTCFVLVCVIQFWEWLLEKFNWNMPSPIGFSKQKRATLTCDLLTHFSWRLGRLLTSRLLDLLSGHSVSCSAQLLCLHWNQKKRILLLETKYLTELDQPWEPSTPGKMICPEVTFPNSAQVKSLRL
jgi:hypothetical protein